MEENAYFRGTIRKAEDEIIINGNAYYGYLGKWSREALWHTKGLNSWSEMGYEVVLYITRNEETEDFFHRFKKVTINNRLWEVQMVNDITSDTMLIIYMKETFVNEFEPAANAEATPEVTPIAPEETQDDTAAIIGKDELYPFDKSKYSIRNAVNGVWLLNNYNKAQIESQTSTEVSIIITSAKSGSVDLIYRRENEEDVVKTIVIKSL